MAVSPFADLPEAKPDPFAKLPARNPFVDLPEKQTAFDRFMGSVARVGTEFSKGFDEVIEEGGGIGFSEDTETKLGNLGLLPDKGALKTVNRAVLEGPAQALELAEATLLGALRGGAQVLREVGASDTTAKQLMRDSLGLIINTTGIGSLGVRGATSRAATPAIVKAVEKLPKEKQVPAAREIARKLDQGPLEQLAEPQPASAGVAQSFVPKISKTEAEADIVTATIRNNVSARLTAEELKRLDKFYETTGGTKDTFETITPLLDKAFAPATESITVFRGGPLENLLNEGLPISTAPFRDVADTFAIPLPGLKTGLVRIDIEPGVQVFALDSALRGGEIVIGPKTKFVKISETTATAKNKETIPFFHVRAVPEKPSVLPLTEPRLSSALQEKIVGAAEELLVSGKVTRDQSIPISMQISDLLQTERITGPEFRTTLERHGLTPETFAKELWDIDISQTARDLGRLGLLSQKVGKLVEGLDADTIAAAGMDADTHAMGFWRRLDNVRRGAMVAQLSTAARNLETQLANVVLVQPAENFVRAAIQRLFPSEIRRAHPLDAFQGVLNIGRKNKAIVEEVLSRFPKLHDDLFLRFSSDITRAKGGTDAMALAEKGMWYLNIANRFQEYLIRRATFRAVLDKRLQAKGLGKIEDFIEGKRIGEIPRDDLQIAVATALERTWARNFSPLSPNKPEALAGSFIQLINKMPLTATVPIPFPRFMMNAMKFQFEFSPAGFIKLLSPKVRAKIAAGDVSVLSKALVGSAMFYAAWEFRNSEFAGDQWWEGKDPETGKIVNLLPFNPFVIHLFTADIIKRVDEGTIGRFTSKELAFGVLSTQLRAGAGLFILDSFLDGLFGSGDEEKALENIKRLGGEVGSSFFVPTQQLRDLYSEFDETQKIVRSSREDPLLGPTKRMLPGLQKQLPEVELPTRAAPPKREEPMVKQLTGLQFRSARNPVEQELIRLKFERREISPSTGDPKADRLINRALGPIVEKAGSALVQSPGYKRLKNDEKSVLLERFLKVARNVVTKELKDREPKLFAKIKISRLPRRQRELIERKVKEQTGKTIKQLIDEIGE